MSRAGFNLSRLRQDSDSLESPGLTPIAPIPDGAGIADQVRNVLSAAGLAAQTIGAHARRATAEEDEQYRGVAVLQAQRDEAPFGLRIRDEILSIASDGGDMSDEAIGVLVERTIGSGLSNPDLTLNDVGVEQYRLSLIGRLTDAAFEARDDAVRKARADALTDTQAALMGVESAEDVDRVWASLRSIDSNLSDADLKARSLDALQTAAKIGSRSTFEALAARIGESPEVIAAGWELEHTEIVARERAVGARVEAATEAYSAFINRGNFAGAEAVIQGSDIPEGRKRNLRDDLAVRRERWHVERLQVATTALENGLYRAMAVGDPDLAEQAVRGAVESGVVQPSELPAFNARFAASLTRRLESRAQVAINRVRDASTAAETQAAFKDVTDVMLAAETALERPATEIGSISQDQFAEIARIAEPVIAQMQDAEFERELLTKLLADSESATGARFTDVQLPGGGHLRADELASRAADVRWEMLALQGAGARLAGETEAAYTERLEAVKRQPATVRRMVDWLARNPAARWSELRTRYNGFVGRAFGAIRATDDPDRMRGVLEDLSALATITQENYDVAARHAGQAIELLDIVGVLHSTLPMDDSDAVAGALAYLMAEQSPVGTYELTPADEGLIDKALANVGLGDEVENVGAIRAEAYAKAKTLATATGAQVELMAKQIADGYRATHRVSHGWAVKVGDLGLAQSIDFEIVDKIVRGVYRKQHGSADGLVFRPHFDGRWRLFERDAIVPVEGSPNLDGDDLRRISGAYRDAARIIAEHEGLERALLERTQMEAGNNSGLRRLGERITSLDPVGAIAAVPGALKSAAARMVSSGIIRERHERWVEQLIEQNTREMDEHERFALELHRNPKPDPDANQRLRESEDVPNIAKAFLRP